MAEYLALAYISHSTFCYLMNPWAVGMWLRDYSKEVIGYICPSNDSSIFWCPDIQQTAHYIKLVRKDLTAKNEKHKPLLRLNLSSPQGDVSIAPSEVSKAL